MSDRAFQRIPYAAKVEFRTASSFLVAYSMNLSRGGIFLETDQLARVGETIQLEFAVPGVGPIQLTGRVAWQREPGSKDGPCGIGVKFEDIDEEIGQLIDVLIAEFRGVRVAVLCAREEDGPVLTRLIRSVVGTAEVVSSPDFRRAEELLTDAIDLAIIEADIYTDIALDVIRRAKARTPPIPVIALASHPDLRVQATRAGADESIQSPPAFQDFRRILVRAMGRPLRVGTPPRPLPGLS
ncbi:TIGR02266 family protein [Haliangium ochraceum]|uniref:Response regulator receiver modulated PilZ sensor protein n=1 Tax=Haliangium ochraceum (strain DSM 14365 / JCM 11303 / SMP-2) TaxID=502025 RepID=D0LQ43_HALO1|nr:TIGR02266 family protein [Haliangium ochraceum]ACY17080.1 response regulator receiver modulated PilZ sensor protein [Haliangium ochraceum DSM 14365]